MAPFQCFGRLVATCCDCQLKGPRRSSAGPSAALEGCDKDTGGKQDEPKVSQEESTAAFNALESSSGPRWLHLGDAVLPPLVEVPAFLRFGDRQLQVVVKPPDPDSLWEWYAGRGDMEADPSWAHVWPSAAALAGLLASTPSLVLGLRVAELGAGLGITGLAAALAGAAEVTLLDREPLALHCAMASAQLNGLRTAAVGAPSDSRPGEAGSVRAAKFDNNDNNDNNINNHWNTQVRAAKFDWSAPCFGRAVDVVLATDVLYDPSSAPQLASTVVALLFSSGGRLLLADPGSERVKGCRAAFIEALQESGASVSVRSLETPNLGEGLESAGSVVLLDARWP
ncbi:unnamed protein product [Polarella glacialis]|uniref:Calmodulin-lysine N-methyltransferase n=1 Tax=Polarella glacialis TaxID=89957 RepID=A0A813D5C5_POLGL|nr:unnamed protein product [Polarella glacialis]